MPAEMKYPREIDGLRALAVLPVISCYTGFTPFAGDYVGVIISEKQQDKSINLLWGML